MSRRVTRTFQCDPGLWLAFTELCNDKGVSASNTIERLVEGWCSERIILIAEPKKDKKGDKE